MSAIDVGPSGFSFTDTKPVIGRVSGSALRLRKRIAYRSSFQTCLLAEVRPDGAGTVIEGKLGMHPFVLGFMGCWFGGVLLIGTLGALGTAASFRPGSTIHHSDDWWMILVIPPAMLIFGTCLVMFGRYAARDEARFLTDFLVAVTAAASPASPPAPPRSSPAAGS